MASSLYFLLPAVGGYSVASYFLLKNPHLLHHKKHTAFHCTHISHRGGCGERIESTMEAFTHAVSTGTEMLELDCHLTKDGLVVVSHDENLFRQTGHDSTISSLNFQELPLYKESLEVTFNTGHYTVAHSDRKFTLLEDLFQKFPKMPVNIEIKENNPTLIDKVSRLVKQYDREHLTVWATTSSTIMKLCQSTNSNMPYMFTVSRVLQLLVMFYCGLLPFVPLGESFLQFYLPHIFNSVCVCVCVCEVPLWDSFLQFYLPHIFNRTFIPESWILRRRVVISLIEKLTMRKSLFEHLVKRGIQVHLFVCNTEEDIAAAFAAGATGVMTDYPTLLANYLHTHPRPA